MRGCDARALKKTPAPASIAVAGPSSIFCFNFFRRSAKLAGLVATIAARTKPLPSCLCVSFARSESSECEILAAKPSRRSICEINSYPNDIARSGLSRAMNTTNLRDVTSLRSRRQHKDFHPNRAARLGTPALGRKPQDREPKIIRAREAGDRPCIVCRPLRGLPFCFDNYPAPKGLGYYHSSASPTFEAKLL